jgi:hypothetical protein
MCWRCWIMFKLFQLVMFVYFFFFVLSALERLPEVGNRLNQAYHVLTGETPSSEWLRLFK